MRILALRTTMVVTGVVMNLLFAARPFNTDDARTVTSSGFEVEVGTNVWQDDAAFGLSLKHGLTNRIDVGMTVGYTMLPDSILGFENTELCFKFAVIPGLCATSFMGILGGLDYVLNGIVTHMIGPVEINMNIGYETTGMQGIEGTFIYGLAIIYDIDKLGVGAEVTGDREDVQAWLSGIRYTVFPGFVLDGGVTGGFHEEHNLTATGGIHYEF